MPELPEVETVRKGLEERLNLFKIKKVEVYRERTIASLGGTTEFKQKLNGLTISKWSRRGKYLIADLLKVTQVSPQKSPKKKLYGWLIIHLRMTGQFQWHEKMVPPCPHTRVSFWNHLGNELRFVDIRSFGQMWWISAKNSPEESISGLKKLGPEPFSKDFNTLYLMKQLKNKHRSIKSALLDQSIVAGAGNIYADESLFSAGILPFKKSGMLTKEEIENLCNSIKDILSISIGKGGMSFSDFRDLEGASGKYGGEALVYRRTNKPCKICGTIIQRQKVAGRSTHWCSNCQK